jgi:hypothetical protein
MSWPSMESSALYAIHFDAPDEIKFCENETNVARLYGAKTPAAYTRTGSMTMS